MFIPNNDIKIVCKLEKDDESKVNINASDNNTAKITTLASNVSISDIFNFSPGYLDSSDASKVRFFGDYPATKNRKDTRFYSFDKVTDYLWAQKNQASLAIYRYSSTTPKNHVTMEGGVTSIAFDPRNILTEDGRFIDVSQYDYSNTNKFLKFVKGYNLDANTSVIKIEHADNNVNATTKIGELPVVYPYFDTATSQIKFIGGGNASDAAIEYAGADSGYFTIESKDGHRYGYFSDANGNKTSKSDFYKFPLPDIDPLQLTLLANIEEYAQKKIDSEENYHCCTRDKKELKDAEYSAKTAHKLAEEAKDEAKYSVELAQKSTKIAMAEHGIKVICKLESDAGKIITISNVNYGKIKVTTISGHTVNIDNIGILDPLIHSMSSSIFFVVDTHYAIRAYIAYSSGATARLFTYKSADEIFQNEGYNDVKIDPKKILTMDGNPIDTTQYTGNRKLEFVQGEKIADNTYAMDLYEYDFSKRIRGDKVGTLQSRFIAIDQSDSRAKLFTFNTKDHIMPLDINLGGYLTLKYTKDGVVGYFSDENGIKDTGLGDEFKIDMNALDFLSSVQIEELAQKKIEPEENYHPHSSALNSAQVKSKAISEVVNRVKRQVEEDAKDEIVDEVKSRVEQNATYQTAQSIISSNKSDVIDQAANFTYGSIIRNSNDEVIENAASKIATDLSLKRDVTSSAITQVVQAVNSNVESGAIDRVVNTVKTDVKQDATARAAWDIVNNQKDEIISQSARNIAGWMERPEFQGERNQVMDRSSIEVAKRINKRSVEDRAVKKVTNKVDVEDVVDRVDPDKAIEELIEVIGSGAAEQIIRGKIQGVNKNRFADKLVQEIGSSKAKDIISDKITDPSLLIDKLLEKSPSAKQKIIAILTDPNNTELIIKAFAEKYPEIDIESIIRNLQRSHAHSSFNVRSALKQTEEAIEKVKEDQQQAEQANQQNIQNIESNILNLRVPTQQSVSSGLSKQEIEEAKNKAEVAAQKAEIAQHGAEIARNSAEQFAHTSKKFSDSAENSAEESRNSAEFAENTLQDMLQSCSNFDREKNGVIGRGNRVRRSTEGFRDSAEESVKKAHECQKRAEDARKNAKVHSDKAKDSVDSLHDIAQRYSNLNRDKSDVLKKAHRVKRSMEIEDEGEKTLTMYDVRRLLEKEINGTTGKIRKDTQNIVS